MRLFAILTAGVLAGCSAGPAPTPVSAKRDVAMEAPYLKSVGELTLLAHEAEALFERGKADEAAALIEKGEAKAGELLRVPRPSLGAEFAASDLDQLYGRMFLSNRRYGWARLQFQKNLARWKHWEPKTDETERRRKLALTAIAECDRHLEQ